MNRFTHNGVLTYNGTDVGQGVEYVFEHDGDPSNNIFGCSTKGWNNAKAKQCGYMQGDTTAPEFDYVCKEGGSSTNCTMGEGVHSINTNHACSAPGADQATCGDFEEVKCHKHRTNMPADSTTLRYCVPGVAGADPQCAATNSSAPQATATTVDCTAAGANATTCAPYLFRKDCEDDILRYPKACTKRLYITWDYGVSGGLALNLQVNKFTTPEDAVDRRIGYYEQNQGTVIVSVNAVSRPSVDSFDMRGHTRSSSAITGELEEAGVDANGDVSTGSMALFGQAGNKVAQFMPFTGESHKDRQLDPSNYGLNKEKFAHSTRFNMEILDVTSNASAVVAVEGNLTEPRFRLVSSNNFLRNEAFYGDFVYLLDQTVDIDATTTLSVPRLYSTRYHATSMGLTAAQIKNTTVDLLLRSYWELTGVTSAGSSFWSGNLATDSWHASYVSASGLVLRTRLYVVEPSTCNVQHITSNPFTVAAPARNVAASGGALEVSSAQNKNLYKEDETVPLNIEVGHIKMNQDSDQFFFGYVEIQDDVCAANNNTLYPPENGDKGLTFSIRQHQRNKNCFN